MYIVNPLVLRYDPSKLILTPHFPPPEPVAAGEENVAIFNVRPGGRNEKNAASRAEGDARGHGGQSGPVRGTQLCNYPPQENWGLSSKSMSVVMFIKKNSYQIQNKKVVCFCNQS